MSGGLALAWADRLLWAVALVLLWRASQMLLDAYLYSHPPAPTPEPEPIHLSTPMSPNAVGYLMSWPEGWGRDQAEGSLREAMQVTGDWDKAVALLVARESSPIAE